MKSFTSKRVRTAFERFGKRISVVLMFWSLLFFGAKFMIKKTQEGLYVEGVKFYAQPDKIEINLRNIKISFPDANIDFNGLSLHVKQFTVEVSVLQLLKNTPYISFSLDQGSCISKFKSCSINDLAKQVKELLEANTKITTKKVVATNISFPELKTSLSGCYDFCSPKEWSFICTAQDQSGNNKPNTTVKLSKHGKKIKGSITRGEELLLKANLIESNKDSWVLYSNNKVNEGVFITQKNKKIFLEDIKTTRSMGWIDLQFKKLDITCAAPMFKRFFPSLVDSSMQNIFQAKGAWEAGSVIASVQADKKLALSIILTNNYSDLKLTTSTDLINRIIPLFSELPIKASTEGSVELKINKKEHLVNFDAQGKNLSIATTATHNSAQILKLSGNLDTKTSIVTLDSGLIIFDQGRIKLNQSFCQIGKENFYPEFVHASGKVENFKLQIPKTCSISLDVEFNVAANSTKLGIQAAVSLCDGTIMSNKSANNQFPPKFSNNLPWQEIELLIKLSNKLPISFVDKDSCLNLNFDIVCPIKMIKNPWFSCCSFSPEGKITVPSGNFTVIDNVFSISSGSILLNKKFNYKPMIDLHASTQIKKHRVDINLFGPLTQPFVNFHSNTNLCHDKIATMIFSGHAEDHVESQMMKIFPVFLFDFLNKQMSTERSSNKIIQKLGGALSIARNPACNVIIRPCLIESKIGKLGAALSFSPSPRFYTNLKKDILNQDCLIMDAEYLLGENSSINVSRDRNKTIRSELEFKFTF